MEGKYYKVFEIDKCFEDYATDIVTVGGNSLQDILDHLTTIFPDLPEKIHRESWMDDDIWNDISDNGKYKDGDTKYTPYFTKAQIVEFNTSLDTENKWPRIQEVPHLFTDTPYIILTANAYME